MKNAPSLSIEQASNGGHTASFRKPGPSEMHYTPPETKVYGKGEHEKMFGDVRKHLGIGDKGKDRPKMKAKVKAPASKGDAIARAMAGSR